MEQVRTGGDENVERRERRVRCLSQGGHHWMVYDDYGPEDSDRVVVCVHGLTRNGRDFERLAGRLARDGWRVLCPDIAGRGRSDPLPVASDYGIPKYLTDLTVMLAHARAEAVDWIGTSMGGLIGMTLSSLPGHPIRRMLINDVGPRVPKEALQRIADYVGNRWSFMTFEDGLAHIKAAYAPFGLTREEDWRYLAEISLKRLDSGEFTNNYDVRISEPFKAGSLEDAELWAIWDAIQLTDAPFVLRGKDSDLLLREDLDGMKARGPGATVHEIAGCGHAPTLMVEEEIAVVMRWINGEAMGNGVS